MRENINFTKLPFDFGVLHYASDTPYTQARTLGARGLSYYGLDSTYASSLAILRRGLRPAGAPGPPDPGGGAPRGAPFPPPGAPRALPRVPPRPVPPGLFPRPPAPLARP